MSEFVTVEGRTLRDAMKPLNAVITPKCTIPVLSCVMLKLGAKGMTLFGTDLDIQITTTIDVIDGAGDWSVCIDAKTLASIARIAGVTPVRIELKDGDPAYALISLGDGEVSYTVPLGPSIDDMPMIGGGRAASIEKFTNGMLPATFAKVAWAISTEETRYYLNGVCWQIRPDGRRMVATDGHRLAACRYSPDGADEAVSYLIPRKTIGLITAHLGGSDIEIFATKNPIALDFVAPGITIRSKLIDGSYPDIDRVIPKPEEQKYRFDLKRPEIVTALDQVMALDGRNGRGVRFLGADGRLTLERRSVDFGTAKVKTSSPWDESAPEFGFNARYLREMVAPCQGEIGLHMVDAGSPFAISDEDRSMTRILMPMRV